MKNQQRRKCHTVPWNIPESFWCPLGRFHPFNVFAVSSTISKISFTKITVGRPQGRGRAFSVTKDNKLLTSIYMVREYFQGFGEWHTLRVVQTAKFSLVNLPQFVYRYFFLIIVVLQKLNKRLGNIYLLIKTSARPRVATMKHTGKVCNGNDQAVFKRKSLKV